MLRDIYTSYAFWRIGPLSGIAVGTGLAILGLWAGPWLSDIGNFNKNEIANILFISTIMMTIGTTSLGVITDYLRKFNVFPTRPSSPFATFYPISRQTHHQSCLRRSHKIVAR